MFRLFCKISVGVLASFVLFPFSFSFLPGINTKMLMAVLGAAFYFFDCVSKQGMRASYGILGASFFAFLFSAICYIAVEYNQTTDYAYATYFASFFTWLGGAYAVSTFIRWMHGEANLKYLTFYLAGVSAFQGIIAIAISMNRPLKMLVDRYTLQGQAFLDEVNRLYGIGAALDPAGVRFTVVLILIVAVLAFDRSVQRNTKVIVQLLLAYFVIAVLGNMISRTTTVGLGLSILLGILGMRTISLTITVRYFRIYRLFITVLVIAVIVLTYLYNTNETFYSNLRFGFEGFFNWMETGVWETSSTNKLNNEMWVWPEDSKTWLIGSGLFDGFAFGTDIGYCRFILYCGLIGFSVFAALQIYNGLYFASREKEYRLLFLFLIAVSFIIWVKVSTDIFQFYALFYCLDRISTSMEQTISIQPATVRNEPPKVAIASV